MLSILKKKESGAGNALAVIVMMLVCVLLVYAILKVRDDSADMGRENLEEAVRHAAVACYASEGVFPDSVEYLEEHYGLQIDRDHYVVHYTVFARNIMPVIKVTEKNNG
jgi:hypothetical protein